MTDTTHLSGYLLDYYAALAENMPNPRLRKYKRESNYICVVNSFILLGCNEAFNPTSNSALLMPIFEKLISNFNFDASKHSDEWDNKYYLRIHGYGADFTSISTTGDSATEAALRALVAWKFPDGLPEPIYESEK
jgi:hypothetical protein